MIRVTGCSTTLWSMLPAGPTGPAPLSSSSGTRRRSNLGVLRAGSAAGAELPGGAEGAHPLLVLREPQPQGITPSSPTPAGAKGERTAQHPHRNHPHRAEPLEPQHHLGLRPLRRVKWRPEAAPPLPPPRAAPAERHRGAPAGRAGRNGGRGPGWAAPAAVPLWVFAGCSGRCAHSQEGLNELKCFSAWELKLCCSCVLPSSPLRGNAAV